MHRQQRALPHRRQDAAGVEQAEHIILAHHADAEMIDRPPALPGTLRALREAFQYADPNIWAVVPEVMRGGEPIHGHPILVGREMIEAFLRAPVTGTAREIEHQHRQHIQYLPVEDPRLGMNIDTPEDYARLAQKEMIWTEKQA